MHLFRLPVCAKFFLGVITSYAIVLLYIMCVSQRHCRRWSPLQLMYVHMLGCRRRKLETTRQRQQKNIPTHHAVSWRILLLTSRISRYLCPTYNIQ